MTQETEKRWKVDDCRLVSPGGITWRSDLALKGAARAEAAFIVQACNAYGSTDALRSALAEFVAVMDLEDPWAREHVSRFNNAMINARAALSSSPAPSTGTLQACAEFLRNKGIPCGAYSMPAPGEIDAAQAAFDRELEAIIEEMKVEVPRMIERQGARAIDAALSDSPAPSTEGLREAPCDCSQEDVHDYGPCGESCRALAVTDEWRAFHSLVQPNVWGIECGDETIIPPSLSERTAKFVAGKYNDRTALAGVTAPPETQIATSHDLPVAMWDRIATAVVMRVAELPEPDDCPKAMLVTSEELHRIIMSEFDAEVG